MRAEPLRSHALQLPSGETKCYVDAQGPTRRCGDGPRVAGHLLLPRWRPGLGERAAVCYYSSSAGSQMQLPLPLPSRGRSGGMRKGKLLLQGHLPAAVSGSVHIKILALAYAPAACLHLT